MKDKETSAPVYDKSVVKRLSEQMGLIRASAPGLSDDERLALEAAIRVMSDGNHNTQMAKQLQNILTRASAATVFDPAEKVAPIFNPDEKIVPEFNPAATVDGASEYVKAFDAGRKSVLMWIDPSVKAEIEAAQQQAEPGADEREEFEREARRWGMDLSAHNGVYTASETHRSWYMWRRAYIAAQSGQRVTLPNGYSIKRVDGHGWLIDPPNGGRWVAHENTPAGDFIAALLAEGQRGRQ